MRTLAMGIVVAAKQLAILAANGSAASEISLRRAALRRKIAPSKPGIRKCSAYMRNKTMFWMGMVPR